MSKQDTVVFRRSRWRSLPFLAVSAATTWVFAEIAVLAAGAGAGGVIALGIFVAPCLCLLVWATLFWAREVLAPHGRVWIAEDGVGQAGAIGAPQTVMHAVLDALRPLGVTELQMPATAESVWRAMRGAGVGS